MKNKKIKETILVVDDEESYRILASSILISKGYEVLSADSGPSALEILKRRKIDLAILDLMMPKIDGRELMKRIHLKSPDLPIIFFTAYGSISSAVEAIKEGAMDYLTKPLPHVDDLVLTVQRVLETVNLRKNNASLLKAVNKNNSFPAKDAVTLQLIDKALKVAKSDVTVLITGESGTGKELLAQFIHNNSLRNNFPLVSINCAAIVDNLLESELFGHEKGAFTGATERRMGRFEEANHSSIFLDEIGEMTMSLQPKLLRALQERELRRVGGNRVIKFDTRIIAATNKDLKQSCINKEFREDLYYRLSVITLRIPPLRERTEDIIFLSELFIDKFSKIFNKPAPQLSKEAKDLLLNYSWPGNVRELSNVIEATVLLSETDEINSINIQGINTTSKSAFSSSDPLADAEKKALITTLQRFDGNRSKTAEFLKMSTRNLIYKLKKHGLTKK